MKTPKSSMGSRRTNLNSLARIAALISLVALIGIPFFSSSSASSLNHALSAAFPSTTNQIRPSAVGLNQKSVMSGPQLFSSSIETRAFPFLMLNAQVNPSSMVATYGADCANPDSSFNLGDTICVTLTNAPTSTERVVRRIELVDPEGFIVDRRDVTNSNQTETFVLPTTATYTTSFGLFIDNRGTWRVNLTDTSDASVSAVAFVTVHDPAVQVADLQISKKIIDNSLVTAGATVESIIWIFNVGPDSASNPRFADTTPSNTTFQSIVQIQGPTFNCTTPGVNNAGTTNCTGASLPKDGVAAFIITYEVSNSVGNGASLESTASAASDTLERSSVDNTSDASLTTSNPTSSNCTLTCPDNITVAADTVNAEGFAGAFVTYAAESSGSCGSVSSAPVSGSFFGVGTSVVTSTTESGASCSFTVTVTAPDDNEAPTISCPADFSVPESSPSADSATVTYSVTATDNSNTATVVCSPASGSSFPVGATNVICTATDPSGNTATCDFDVTVTETNCTPSGAPTPDVATLPTITRSCTVVLTASDAPRATDSCGANIVGTTTDPLTYDTPGTYTINWTYTNSVGTTTQQQTIVVPDDISAPVPNSSSLSTVTGECSVTLTPPTASDNCDGDLIGTTNLLTLSTPGTHTVTWTFTDSAGNSSTQNQTVIVTDSAPPSISLNGPSSVTVECHTAFTDPGASATDNCDTSPEITSGSVDVNIPGTYTITYTATDDAGNQSSSVVRTVNVVDTTAPVLALNGASSITVECHTSFTDPGATAADSCDSNVPAATSGAVDPNVVGVYTITYNASDDSGNAATPVTRTVHVVDTTSPVITVNGANPATVECHTSFTDPGATADDGCSGSLSVTSSNNVNIDTPGSYTVTYSAVDGAGNTQTATRTVNVVDTVAPTVAFNNLTIFLNSLTIVFGTNTFTVNGTTYPFNGVSCTHNGYTFSFNGQTVTVTKNGQSFSYTFSGKTLVLWTPTHQYQTVKVADLLDSASDSCDANADRGDVVISQVTSDEPDNAAGNSDGNTVNDIVIAADCKSVQLRAERNSNGNGRVYTIAMRVRDTSGNETTVTSKLKIFAGSFNVVDNGPQYTVNGTCP